MNQKNEYDAIIVGAGLAGLSAAISLSEAGQNILLLEKSDRVGGRLKTDRHQGFLLDHGFQVLLTAYPQCKRLLDYEALDLGHFAPGALLWKDQSFDLVADPFRHPELILKTLTSNSGSLADKLRIAKLAAKLATQRIEEIYKKPEISAIDSLREDGFSETMIETFFRPFFSGIFLESELASSSRMLNFVFKCFGSGYAALPSGGMAEIPRQLAARLAPNQILFGESVTQLNCGIVSTKSGQKLHAKELILATDMHTAAHLSPAVEDRGWNATQCFYFSAPRSPLDRPMIALNASGNGVIKNLSVPSDINPSYAPEGKSLICVNVEGDTEVDTAQVTAELQAWFGDRASQFERLKQFSIPMALPRQRPGDNPFSAASLRDENGTWLCGDHRFSSSIEGALKSGERVAAAILKQSS